ncbi:predicted protein, partial [Nematostella vectensis]
LSPCQRRRLLGTALGRGNVEGYIPHCKSDGRYEEVQCHTGTKYCWCVDEKGVEVWGTRTRTFIRCAAFVKEPTPCQRAKGEALLSPETKRVPNCRPDGSYSRVQCDKSTGECWCSSEDGSETPGTRTSGTLRCPANEFSACQKHRHRVQGMTGQAPVGAYVPRCADDGSYETVQCHDGTRYCWCVDEDGKERPGT